MTGAAVRPSVFMRSFRNPASARHRCPGDQLGRAIATYNLGELQRLTGDYPAAAASQQQALQLYRDLGHRKGEAAALSELGILHSEMRDYPAAASAYQQALGLFCDFGYRYGEAEVLKGRGRPIAFDKRCSD